MVMCLPKIFKQKRKEEEQKELNLAQVSFFYQETFEILSKQQKFLVSKKFVVPQLSSKKAELLSHHQVNTLSKEKINAGHLGIWTNTA